MNEDFATREPALASALRAELPRHWRLAAGRDAATEVHGHGTSEGSAPRKP